VSGQRHVPAALYLPGKGPPVPIVQEAGWAPELVWTQARGKIISSLPGIEPRWPGRPARSQNLYWLSYPASSEYSKRKISPSLGYVTVSGKGVMEGARLITSDHLPSRPVPTLAYS
jgi:hypothetical protein